MARRRRADRVRTRGRRCATRSGPSSGRWRARRWPPSPGPSSTCVGLARQDNQAAIQLFVDPRRQDDRARRVPARRGARGDRRRGPDQLPRAVLHPRRVDPARGLRAVADRRGRASLEAFLAERRGGPVHLRVPQRGEKRELHGPRHAQRRRDARPRAGPLAGRPGQDAGRARGAGRGARPARAAAPHRVLRHQQLPGQRIGRQHGRLRGRQAALRRVPPVPDQDRRRARTTSPATRRSCAAGSGRSGPARRGARRRAAGRCPTSSSSTAARARSAPPRRSSTSSASTTCRWPAWPRSARSCSCPTAPTRSSCRATSPALYLVQRLRDEAHRFAITYHRDLRARRSVRSAFDDLPGVGPKRKRELLKVFGSIKRVRDAPVEQIAAVPGHRAVAGRPDQGDARGLTQLGSEFFIVRCTASLPLQASSGRGGREPEERACTPSA